MTKCHECNDTGARDSGGTHPWGEPVLLPCDCKDAEIGRRWREDSSLEKWFPITAERLAALEAENFTLAAGQCANVTGDDGGTPVCLEVLRLRAEVEALRADAAAAVAAERAACARVCEALEPREHMPGDWVAGWSDGTEDCAAAIRKRASEC